MKTKKQTVHLRDIFENGGFSFKGVWITNPYFDETRRFEVDPFRFYNIVY